MTSKVRCPACRHEGHAVGSSGTVGRVKCPKCGHAFTPSIRKADAHLPTELDLSSPAPVPVAAPAPGTAPPLVTANELLREFVADPDPAPVAVLVADPVPVAIPAPAVRRKPWAAILGVVLFVGLGLAATHFTGEQGKPANVSSPPNIIEVDLSTLPPDLIKELQGAVVEPRGPAKGTPTDKPERNVGKKKRTSGQ